MHRTPVIANETRPEPKRTAKERRWTRPAAGGLGQSRIVGVIAVVLIVAAVFAVVQIYRNSRPHAVRFVDLPPGSSEKAQAMKAQGKRPFGDESASDLIGGGSGSPTK